MQHFGRSYPRWLILVAHGVCWLTAPSASADQSVGLNFENDIVPILSRYACNASGCHGKAEGQNGFKLSVFGFDPPADHRALTTEGRGRRVFPAAPERSLLLLKASGGLPHGGGVRITPDRPEYATLRTWIAQGCRIGSPDDPRVIAITVHPGERQLALGQSQQLVVTAQRSDGQKFDVTALARFQSNNDGLAAVNEDGLVTAGQTPGVAAVMASYLGQVAVCHLVIPRAESAEPSPQLVEHNFIDALVDRRLRQLNIRPSEVCTDAEFLRRVYLDLIGTLPTVAETRQYLSDTHPDRQRLLVEQLLERPEFADYWTLRWSDLLRVDRQALGHQGAYATYRWIRQSVAEDKPLDQFAREVITATGLLAENPAGYLYRAVPQPGQAASTLSQVFLGVRIECAQCHHHPYDRWSQHDYFGMAAYFTNLSHKDTPFGEVLWSRGVAVASHPRTGEKIGPHALGQPLPTASSEGDMRPELGRWMTSPDNPWFARNLSNRIWAHLLGRGLVEPVDDLRATNPPSNPELLDALAAELVRQQFRLKGLLRTITASRVYQQSSRPNPTNVRDELNYSRALLKRLPAEVLLDAVCQVTGVPEKFPGAQGNERAIRLWDSQVDHDFLKLFGRPARTTACECERVVEPSVAQVLHLLNSERVQAKLDHEHGFVAQLCRRIEDDGELVEECYLALFNRYPTDRECDAAVRYLRQASEEAGDPNPRPSRRRDAVEDLAWTMLNSLEFVFNH